MSKQQNLMGKTFYKLHVIDKEEVYKGKYIWICKCECGTILKVQGSELKKEHKKSCGCWRKPNNKIDPSIRFFKFVNKTEFCWLWTGSYCYYGYGQISINGKPRRAHRISYEMHKGEIPKDMFVCHKCDNPSCVNPDHLFLGTQEDNMKDMFKKNRQNTAKGERRFFSKLKNEDIPQIRELYNNNNRTKIIANIYGVSTQSILDIINGKAWKHVV